MGHRRRVGIQRLTVTVVNHVVVTRTARKCSRTDPRWFKDARGPVFRGSRSAAAAGGSAAFADVAATAGAHLRTAGQAEWRVDAGAGDLFEELRCGMRAQRSWLDRGSIHLVGTHLVARVVLERLGLAELFLDRQI